MKKNQNEAFEVNVDTKFDAYLSGSINRNLEILSRIIYLTGQEIIQRWGKNIIKDKKQTNE